MYILNLLIYLFFASIMVQAQIYSCVNLPSSFRSYEEAIREVRKAKFKINSLSNV